MIQAFVTSDEIRTSFSGAMSGMYRREVPQYGTLLDLVAEVNAAALLRERALLANPAESARLEVERHGAIRLGTPHELDTIRRIFAVMGMFPVGYYDLSAAGVPVHSTAFRPVTESSLAANPFRVFTSLLRLELIRDPELRDLAAEILGSRDIFSARALELTARFEATGGLTSSEADEFVREVLHTFRWHGMATVPLDTYMRLHDAHRLIADVVSFQGPHINHLTPRTLDIDAAQAEMPRRGIVAKDVIEGPPRRKVPILLRQTSFKALEETVRFAGGHSEGAHTARFGEIEQRGIALTRKGRVLYDSLLQRVREKNVAGSSTADYQAQLVEAFEAFPDDLDTMRRERLGFFRYSLRSFPDARIETNTSIDALVEQGIVDAAAITYEDFLPVSAAGIFQSNLGETGPNTYSAAAARAEFEQALGSEVLDEIELYEAQQAASIEQVRRHLARGASE
ncbi:2-oxoadipate dioxygenase/decarboxylase HglS [Caenimonas soli]|uniref:2-oxoadipate dioxygenase/decarboxylase HglS n=1 Tax=Caenimonas soli TaxID=2735555 RepID=UPI001552BFB6|nr:VOC family protein [Caenimonas soli]NPC58338.1 VOC family protein [Caenimonas soli]